LYEKMLKNQKGFSLVELLIVIAIMGVLAAVAFSMLPVYLATVRDVLMKEQQIRLQKLYQHTWLTQATRN